MKIIPRVREFVDYNFTLEEIIEELNNRPEKVVRAAYQFVKDNRSFTSQEIGISDKTPGNKNPKMHTRDKNIEFYELIWREGRKEINWAIRNLGSSHAAKYFRVDRKVILALQQHYDYKEGLPQDYLEQMTYFPEEVRREVDKRDKRECIRCGRKLKKCLDNEDRQSKFTLNYHKIQHPGPIDKSNCATLCYVCRRRLQVKHKDKDTFEGMDFTEFKQWISEHDPAQG